MKIKALNNLMKIENWKLKITLLAICFIILNPQEASAALIVQAPKYIGLNSGLVGYWSFDGPDMNATQALDRAGQGNNGTLTNGPKPTLGRLGQALSFDGVDDYVTKSSANGTTNTPVSASAWIYPRTQGLNDSGQI